MLHHLRLLNGVFMEASSNVTHKERVSVLKLKPLITKPTVPARYVAITLAGRTKFWIDFYTQAGDDKETVRLIGQHITPDGSYIKLAKIVAGYLKDGLMPITTERTN